MRAEERRDGIAALLRTLDVPVSGSELAQRFGVSRQIIVQDISVLKAAGLEILSTHNGYILQAESRAQRVFKVYHTTEETEDELSCIVALGGTVADVFVRHKVYGKIEAKLNIFNSDHVRRFIEGVRSGKSSELMNVTGGYHYHTVRAENQSVLDRIEAELRNRGYLAE